MKHSVFAASFLYTALAAGVLFAATPGVTAADRNLALEFQKRLAANKAPETLARSLTLIYLRRAYVLDVDPAQAVAKVLFRKSLRLKEEEQMKYFAWSLDALVRGAKLKDIETTLKGLLKDSYGKTDTPFFIESFFDVASPYASPVPLEQLTKIATNNGMIGRRRKELITWVLDQVKRGEDPEYILQIYDAIDNTVPSLRNQRDYLTKCYNAVRLGVPPHDLARAAVRMSKQTDTTRQLNEKTDELLKLYFSGTEFGEALDKVAPPPKKVEEEEED
ncbi:MAG: hypothetical protein ABIF82_02775 [Planctomycetota bacterium]